MMGPIYRVNVTGWQWITKDREGYAKCTLQRTNLSRCHTRLDLGSLRLYGLNELVLLANGEENTSHHAALASTAGETGVIINMVQKQTWNDEKDVNLLGTYHILYRILDCVLYDMIDGPRVDDVVGGHFEASVGNGNEVVLGSSESSATLAAIG